MASNLEERREARRRRRMEELSALYQDEMAPNTSVSTSKHRENEDDDVERKRQERRQARETRPRGTDDTEEEVTSGRRTRRRGTEDSEEAPVRESHESHHEQAHEDEAADREREEVEDRQREVEATRRSAEEQRRAEERRRQAAEDEARSLREEQEEEDRRRQNEALEYLDDMTADRASDSPPEMEDSGYQETMSHDTISAHVDLQDNSEVRTEKYSTKNRDLVRDDANSSKHGKWKQWEEQNKRDSEQVNETAVLPSGQKRENLMKKLKEHSAVEDIDETARWVKTKKDARGSETKSRTPQSSSKAVGSFRAKFESKINSQLDSSSKSSHIERKIVGTSSLKDLQKRFESGATSHSLPDLDNHPNLSTSNTKILKISTHRQISSDSSSHETAERFKQNMDLEIDGNVDKPLLPNEKFEVTYTLSPKTKEPTERIFEIQFDIPLNQETDEITPQKLEIAEENVAIVDDCLSDDTMSKGQSGEFVESSEEGEQNDQTADTLANQELDDINEDNVSLRVREEEREEEERLEKERRKEELAKKKEEEEQRKKGKRRGLGGLNPEKKKLLKDNTSPTRNQEELDKRRTLRQRIKPLPDLNKLSTADLQKLCKDMHAKVAVLEEYVYDNEMKIRKQAWEINELTLKVNDTKGKFIKPVLRKINKTEGKFGKLTKEREDFRSNLKSTGQQKYALEDESMPKTPEWREGLGKREDEEEIAE